MRVKVKRKERLELEEEREDLLDLFVVLRRPAEKRACIELIEEVDACLDDVYSAHEAAKSFPRMLYNCVTQYAFKPDQIVSIRNAWQSRMALDRDRVWIRLPPKLKLKRFTWEEGLLCFLNRLASIQTFSQMVPRYGLKESDLCALFGFMLEDFCNIFGHLLQDLTLYAPYLPECAMGASNNGMPFDNCPFFLDGTFRRVSSQGVDFALL